MSAIFPLHSVSVRSAEGQLQCAVHHPAGGVCEINRVWCSWLSLSFQTPPTLRKCWLTPNKSPVHPSLFIYTHTVSTYVCKTFASCLSVRRRVPIGGEKDQQLLSMHQILVYVFCIMLTRSLHGGQHTLLTVCSLSNWRATWYLLLYL